MLFLKSLKITIETTYTKGFLVFFNIKFKLCNKFRSYQIFLSSLLTRYTFHMIFSLSQQSFHVHKITYDILSIFLNIHYALATAQFCIPVVSFFFFLNSFLLVVYQFKYAFQEKIFNILIISIYVFSSINI